MNLLSSKTNLLRPREGHGTAPVAQIELFFDLVFVFAITQLSATLRAHLNPAGFLHSLMLFAGVWWVWVYTSWVTNWLDPQTKQVRAMLIILMLLALVLADALPEAFNRRGLVFAATYVAMQLGRSLFMLWAVRRHHDGHSHNFARITIWFAASGVFWLAGAVLPLWPRTVCWLIALALDITSPSLGSAVPGLGHSATNELMIDSYHLAERCGGFILIALGESITVTGDTFFGLNWNRANGAGFLAAFLGVIALWWIYFDKAADRAADAFAESEDTGKVARSAYTYLHALLVAGIIVVAAGDGFLLQHPGAPISREAGLLLVGGPALYLLGNGLFRAQLHPRFPPSHVLGICALALLGIASFWLSVLTAAWAVNAVLLAVIIYSDFLFRKQER